MFTTALLIALPPTLALFARKHLRFWRQARLTGLAISLWLLALLPACQALSVAFLAAAQSGPYSIAVPAYQVEITAAANRHGIDAALLAAVVQAESNYSATAVSSAGAMGLAQLMPATAAACQLTDPFDPAQNLDCAARTLADLLRRYDLHMALAAYNAGEGAVTACDCIPANGETEVYVPRVLAAYDAIAAGGAAAVDHQALFARLYGRQPWRITQSELHGLAGWRGVDASAGCGALLYAPVGGIVTYNGLDGYDSAAGGESSMMSIDDGRAGTVHLLHGVYLARAGTAVNEGDLIGYEAAVGNATGCHTHLVIGR